MLVTDEVPRAPEREIGAIATLRKPVDMDALRTAVSEAVPPGPRRAGWTSRAG